jgi:hypothetical protein
MKIYHKGHVFQDHYLYAENQLLEVWTSENLPEKHVYFKTTTHTENELFEV